MKVAPANAGGTLRFQSDACGPAWLRWAFGKRTPSLRMKHNSTVCIAGVLGLLLILFGHVANGASSPKAVFVTKYSRIEIAFPPGWRLSREENPYDLQCLSKNEEMATGVFVFKKEDLASPATPTDRLKEQITDLSSKRSHFKVLEPLSMSEKGNAKFTTVTYSGEKGLSRYCYRFTLVEFKSDDSKFAVLIQTSLAGEWKNAKPIFEEIAYSARPLKDEP